MPSAISSIGSPVGALTLRRNFSWTLIANVIYAICQWGIIAVIAKMGDPEMVGQFALGLAITAPIALFFQMQLRSVQATDAMHLFVFGDYLRLRAMTTVLAIVLCLAVAIVGNYSPTTILVIALVALGKAIDSIADVFYGRFQQLDRMDIIAKATMINGTTSLILLGAGVAFTGSLIVGVVGYAIGSMLPLILYVLPAGRLLSDGSSLGVVELSSLTKLFLLALPLGIVMLLVSLTSNVPRFVIEHDLGTEQLGVFAAVAYLIVAGTTVVGALGQAASPRLSRLFASAEYAEFRRLAFRLMGGGLLLGVLGYIVSWLVGRRLLVVLYTEDFATYDDVLRWLSLAAGATFAASFAGYVLTAARKFSVQVPIFVIVLAVSIITSLVFIPEYGLKGAAWSIGLSQLVNLTLCVVVLLHTLRHESGNAEC